MQAARSTFGPMISIRPLCSATSMNTEGGIVPRVGCCQRSSTSTPTMRRSRMRKIGW